MSEIEMFSKDPKNEFYNDVRSDMADLLDLANNRGQDMTLQQAYDKACAMHPQISQIMASRAARNNAQDKRRAAASISGSPGGPGEAAEPTSTRAALEAAWENAGRT
jgi:hypothetical protein